MNSVSFDILTLLQSQGFGTIGTNMFGNELGTVDAQILVSDTGAYDSQLHELYENPTFQIIVRGNKKESNLTSYNKIRAIYEYLNTQGLTTINSQEYELFKSFGGINGLGRDDNDRYVWSCNFMTYRKIKGE